MSSASKIHETIKCFYKSNIKRLFLQESQSQKFRIKNQKLIIQNLLGLGRNRYRALIGRRIRSSDSLIPSKKSYFKFISKCLIIVKSNTKFNTIQFIKIKSTIIIFTTNSATKWIKCLWYGNTNDWWLCRNCIEKTCSLCLVWTFWNKVWSLSFYFEKNTWLTSKWPKKGCDRDRSRDRICMQIW